MDIPVRPNRRRMDILVRPLFRRMDILGCPMSVLGQECPSYITNRQIVKRLKIQSVDEFVLAVLHWWHGKTLFLLLGDERRQKYNASPSRS